MVIAGRPKLKKWLLLSAKVLIVVTLVWFVHGRLAVARQQIADQPLHLNFRWLVLAGVIYLLGLLPAGLFWHHVLRALGQDARLGWSLRAYYISHLGKYVPGKAMVVVLRAGLVQSQQVHAGVAAAAVFYETLTMMAGGAAIGAAFLAVAARQRPLLCLGALGLMLLTGLPTLPPVFARLARLAGVGRSDPATAEKLGRLSYRTLWIGWAAMLVLWVLLGLSLWATLCGMGVGRSLSWDHLFGYTGSVALAVVAGFLSFIPSGLVVRDIALLELVRLFGVDAGDAAIAAVLLRLVWLLSELAISGILYVGGLRRS